MRTNQRVRVRRARAERRGVALVVVLMLVLIMSIMGLALIELVRLDLSLVTQAKATFRAREVVEGGMMEVLGAAEIQDGLPLFDNPRWDFTTDGDFTSEFDRDGDATNYANAEFEAQANLLRFAPLQESSITWTRALIYEFEAVGSVDNGIATKELRVEGYKVLAFEPGLQLPNTHWR